MCNAKKMKTQPLASPEESIELQSPEERPEVSQETEPESSEQGTILADTSVVADISRTDLNSDSEPEELNPQDVFDEWILGLKKSGQKHSGHLPVHERSEEANSECNGSHTRSCLNNWLVESQ